MSIQRDQKNIGGASVEMIIAWCLVPLFGYFLPWAIAATRRKSNSLSIMLINLLLGWTFIGWVIALVMACAPHQVAARPLVVAQPMPMLPPGGQQPVAPPGWYPQPDGSQKYWDGQAWR
jgi:hypothetical protein